MNRKTLRNCRKLFGFPFRLITSPWRCLPDVVIIGTMKGGTSELFNYLASHPDSLPSVRKETHYFDRYSTYGTYFYKSFFPVRLKQRKFSIEATPRYMFNTNVPERMRRLNPGARLIAILREPASRAYSHYRHMVARGREKRTFGVAIDQNFDELGKRGCLMGTDNHFKEYNTYIERGIYEPQIRQYKSIFGGQLLVLCSEEFFQDPLRVLEDVRAFIGARSYAFKRRQYSGREVEQPCVRTIEKLKSFYKPYNEKLYQSLNICPMWK